MTHALRIAALLMAIAAVVDPAFAGRRRGPLAVDVRLPHAADPQFAEATRVRDSILQALGEAVHANGSEPPSVVLAIGNAEVDGVPAVPVFAVRVAKERAAVTATRAPAVSALWGQRAVVSASFQAGGVKDRTTTFTLAGPGGATFGSVEHRWAKDDEAFEPSFHFAPLAPGLAVLRITAHTEGVAAAQADVLVSTADRRARVFVFEPRPSWAVAFARHALESDPLFEVRALARTSRGIVTESAGAPSSLATLDPESTDVIVVGGLEALTDPELVSLRRFVDERGGTVVLAPDARVPEKVRRAFDLPSTEEALVERPTELRQGETRVRATELLRVTGVAHPPGEALLVVPRGEGQVLLALALDAWRHRGDRESGFSEFWRAVTADAATAAASAATVALDPALARPGDQVNVRVRVRLPSASTGGDLRVPGASAVLVSAGGDAQPMRLWPGTAAGEYAARLAAPASGRYDLRVDIEGHPRHDAVLVVDAGAAPPVRDRAAEMAFLAEATGGAVVPAEDLSRLVTAIGAMPVTEQPRQLWPTRSAWWMLGFTSLLCAEWAVRRTRGLR